MNSMTPPLESWPSHPLGHAFQITPSRASACGKAILVGEHGVVYGAEAVAIPLMSMRIDFSGWLLGEGDQSRIHINGDDFSGDAEEIIRDGFTLLNLPYQPIRVQGQSKVPIGAGLGSSATLCVGILRTIAAMGGIHLSSNELAKLANHLEKRFHGNPSGLDAAVVAAEMPIKFRRGQNLTTVAVNPISDFGTKPQPWRFAIIDSKERASTKAMVERAKPFFTSSLQPQIVASFDKVTAAAIQGLEEGKAETVAHAMNEACDLLRDAGVLTASLEGIVQACKDIGLIGYKPTGAGGGGCILGLLSPDAADRQLAELQELFGAEHIYEAVL